MKSGKLCVIRSITLKFCYNWIVGLFHHVLVSIFSQCCLINEISPRCLKHSHSSQRYALSSFQILNKQLPDFWALSTFFSHISFDITDTRYPGWTKNFGVRNPFLYTESFCLFVRQLTGPIGFLSLSLLPVLL